MSDKENNTSNKNPKNANYEGNNLETQKDLIKEESNKNKVEIIATKKEEKYGETPYRWFFFSIILFNVFRQSNSVGMLFCNIDRF